MLDTLFGIPILEQTSLSFALALQKAGLREDAATFIATNEAVALVIAESLNFAYTQTQTPDEAEAVFSAAFQINLMSRRKKRQAVYRAAVQLIKGRGGKVSTTTIARVLGVTPQAVSQTWRKYPMLKAELLN